MNNTIITVPPGMLSKEVKEKLELSGAIVIETDSPEKIKILSANETLLSADILSMAALEALNSQVVGHDKFVKALYQRLTAKPG